MIISEVRLADLNVGDDVFTLEKPPISRSTLALFSDASNDRNSVHTDITAARRAGFPDVIAPGMLIMAYLAQVITNRVPQNRLRKYCVRFSAVTQLGDAISGSARLVEKLEQDGECLARLEVLAVNQDGDVKLTGEVLVVLD